MRHIHYHRVSATSHFEMGKRLGELFKPSYLEKYQTYLKKEKLSAALLEESKKYFTITRKYFPQYIEELEGYAKGVGVDFSHVWHLYLIDDLTLVPEKCTTVFSKGGVLIGHNEDNFDFLGEHISLLEKTMNGNTILELHYDSGLGGDACSINSYGFVQTINTLHHTDHQIGVPRNIIARWLSETKDPQSDFDRMKKIPRAAGYSHTFASPNGDVTSIESSALHARITIPSLPFIHTNHFLSKDLIPFEDKSHSGNSKERALCAVEFVPNVVKTQDMFHLLERVSNLPSNDRRESKTIARMVFDLNNKVVWSWLQRENSLGWVQYPLSFL